VRRSALGTTAARRPAGGFKNAKMLRGLESKTTPRQKGGLGGASMLSWAFRESPSSIGAPPHRLPGLDNLAPGQGRPFLAPWRALRGPLASFQRGWPPRIGGLHPPRPGGENPLFGYTVHLFSSRHWVAQKWIPGGHQSRGGDKVEQPCTCYTGASYLAPFPASDAQETLYLQGYSEIGAGDGNRTHVTSLEGWSSTIELHPHASNAKGFRPVVNGTNCTRRGIAQPGA
jgi:hypothetical protein